MSIVYIDRWCPKCASVENSLRTSKFYMCMKCYTQNDGKHPAEHCLGVKNLQAELHEETRKTMNRQRVFPQLRHSQHIRSTCMGSRSIKIQMFKKFK